MMKKFLTVLFVGMTFCMTSGHAQTNREGKNRRFFQEFRDSIRADFALFRQQCMEEFVAFVRNPWKEFEAAPPVPKPLEKPLPPVIIPQQELNRPIAPRPVIINEVVEPQPIVPQPQPVEPIKEVPTPKDEVVTFDFYGTTANVRFNLADRVTLKGVDMNSVADALLRISSTKYDNLIVDCLALRKQWSLCDWAYLQLLKNVSDAIAGCGSNEAALLLSYLYLQSGYQMRLATDGSKLYMLYSSKFQIYEKDSYKLGNDLFYGVEELPDRLYICEAAFPKEQSLSLFIPYGQTFAKSDSDNRTLKSSFYPDLKVHVAVNKHLVDFYNTYPQSMVDGNFMTRWAMYAQTPLDEAVKEQLYPQLSYLLSGQSELEAVNRLLNLLQTGLEYEYDNKIWGYDRPFFAEETLYYPYCDCEDRAILLSRLVRDLLHLDTILVYYPGHLAMAVAFANEVNGDYITYKGRRFTICDPTYIGAPVGKTMPEMDNQTATVILLNN